jgi:hypothetical protein
MLSVVCHDHPSSSSSVATPEGRFNHPAAVYLVVSIGLVGCIGVLASPATSVPLLVGFAAMLAAGLCYFVHVLRRRSRRRAASMPVPATPEAPETTGPLPDDPKYDALIATARTELRAHDLARAEHAARDALRHAPERGAAYNMLAIIRLLQARLPEAYVMLSAGLAVDPSCRELRTNRLRPGRADAAQVIRGDAPPTVHPYR